jgi:hypothetical protein
MKAPRRSARPSRTTRPEDLDLVVVPAEGAAEAGPMAAAEDDRQVEVRDVPSRQHVWVGGANVGEEAVEERALVGHYLGAGDRPGRDHEDVLAADAGRRDAVEVPPVRARLDVEREDAEGGGEVVRLEHRVAVDAADTRPLLERAVDAERPAEAAVDQVAVGEAEVGLEALDALLAEPPPDGRHVAREVDLDARHRLAGECREVLGRHPRARRGATHRRDVAGADEEVGLRPAIYDERWFAGLQDRVEVHLGDAGYDPVGRGQEKCALGHAVILPLPAAAY